MDLSHNALTLQEAARYTGVSLDTIRDRIRKGILKARRTGPYPNSKLVIDRAELDKMLHPVPTVTEVPTQALSDVSTTLASIDARLAKLEAATGQAGA